MNKNNIKIVKADPDFVKEIRNIKLDRIRRGKDNEIRSDRRITKAIIRSSLWNELREVIVNSPLENDLIEDRRRK